MLFSAAGSFFQEPPNKRFLIGDNTLQDAPSGQPGPWFRRGMAMKAGTVELPPRVFFGRRLTRRQLSDVRRTTELMQGLSRHELAHTVCEYLGWRAGSGENSVYSVLKKLEVLEKEGLVTLPELGGVALEIVREATDVVLFSELVDRYHGRGHRQPVGCHLRYFIVDGQGRWLAGEMEGAAAAGRDLRGRDDAFGNRLPRDRRDGSTGPKAFYVRALRTDARAGRRRGVPRGSPPHH